MKIFPKKSQFYLTKKQSAFLILISILISVYVFYPHFPSELETHPLPLHMDEWNHVTQAINLEEGEYNFNSLTSLQVGFHFFLFILNKPFDLILIYKFLPAIWAFITSIVLFFLVYTTTNKNFFISIVSIIFFGTIGFNNLYLGASYFTPLTFAIPFIYLFMFLFIQGLQNKNKKYLLISLGIMLFLLPIHAPSVLFAIPIMMLLGFLHFGHIRREYKFFLLFLFIPLAGLFFYGLVTKTSSFNFQNLINLIIFNRGWAGIEMKKISFIVLYTFLGFLFSILGFLGILIKKEKKYIPYLIWPAYLFISILLFNLSGVSLFSPVQRNYYYFLLGLPMISSLGVYYIANLFNHFFKKINKDFFKSKKTRIILITSITVIILFLVYFSSFSQISKRLPGRVNMNDYESLMYLSEFPKGSVLAPVRSISFGVRPISKHYPIAVLYFNHAERQEEVDLFFSTEDCEIKNSIVKKYYVNYVISDKNISCDGYELLYSKKPYIYKTPQIN